MNGQTAVVDESYENAISELAAQNEISLKEAMFLHKWGNQLIGNV